MFDVTDVINDPDVMNSVTIVRTATPTIVNGRISSLSTSNNPIFASVQPMPSAELEFMPEGLVNQGVMQVFCQFKLLTTPMPDRFDFPTGITWEIFKVDDWSATAGYWRGLATRVTQT